MYIACCKLIPHVQALVQGLNLFLFLDFNSHGNYALKLNRAHEISNHSVNT